MALKPIDILIEIRSFIEKNQEAFPPESNTEIEQKDSISNYFFLKEILENWAREKFGKEELNFSLFSGSVIRSLSDKNRNEPHQAVDYQLLFLHYLILNFEKRKSLIEYIDGFLEENKDQLVIKDIGITKSGATRAKTHLRFSVNDLRNMGMIVSRDIEKKRSWQPSVMGVIIMLAALKKPGLKDKFSTLTRSGLLPLGAQNTEAYIGGFRYYDTRLFDKALLTLIREYLSPGALYGVIAEILTDHDASPFKSVLENLQEQYTETVIEGLTILEKDVKKTKEFNNLSNKFHAYLADEEKNHKELFKAIHRGYIDNWCKLNVRKN